MLMFSLYLHASPARFTVQLVAQWTLIDHAVVGGVEHVDAAGATGSLFLVFFPAGPAHLDVGSENGANLFFFDILLFQDGTKQIGSNKTVFIFYRRSR